MYTKVRGGPKPGMENEIMNRNEHCDVLPECTPWKPDIIVHSTAGNQ
jgi:hypothetical protein